MTANLGGALAFGVVIGWVTYRTLRRNKPNGLSDIATVIGAIGGATITGLFPRESETFGYYGIGLFIGFVGYLIIGGISSAVAKQPLNEWLGEPPVTQAGQKGGGPL